ncbi:MAG: hypothetical protein ISS31_04075 [Kiritimatiellae bacterium]|nr:hypothetical protein [Kiritimatiellia bacterium]
MQRYEETILESGIKRLGDMLDRSGFHGHHLRSPRSGESDGVFEVPCEGVTLYLEVRDSLHPYQVKQIVERNSQRLQREDGTNQKVLVVLVRDLTRSTLDQCIESGLCVLTEGGNGYIRFTRFLYHRFVPAKSRRKSSSGPGSIFSAKASRIVRAMLARYPDPWSQSALVGEADISRGYVSSVVKKMLDADYVRRDNGRLRVVDPDRLLDDWAARYRFDRHNRSRFAISMGEYGQGLRKFQQEMRRHDIRCALTAWSAAYLRASYGSPDSIVAYVDRPVFSLNLRSLHEVEGKGNVLVLVPQDEGVFQFGQETDLGYVVSDVQCYLDLLNLPGRASEQAEVLREKRLDFKEMIDAK